MFSQILCKLSNHKKDFFLFFLFFLTNLSFISRGPIRYAVLTGIALFFFFIKKNEDNYHYVVFIHIIVYLFFGFLFAFLNRSLPELGIKQGLIYFCCGFVAVNFFDLYGTNNTTKLLDLQLYGICAAYVLLYFFYNKNGTLYWESHIFAYILGLYGVLYYCQKRYDHMLLSMIIMLFDHKRIANLAIIITLLFICFFKYLKDEKKRNVFIIILCCMFIFSSILWIYLMSTSFLSEFLNFTDHFTSLRMTLWKSAKPHYSFSPFYIGKGIGFVKNWMVNEGVFGLENLHNDFLAAYIELGFIGYIFWILSFLLIFFLLKNRIYKLKLQIGFLFFVYMFINFLTDNTYIYISFMLPFYLIILSLFFGTDSDSYLSFLK